jgi:tetratricopeptide (TPR) repeat protein
VSEEPPVAGGRARAHGDRAEELLWHLERAGDPAAAFPYACAAARAASQGREFLHARSLYAKALDLLERLEAAGQSTPAGAPGHHELTIRYAEVLAATGERIRACELLRPLAEPIPRSAEGMRLRGAFLRDQGDFAGARQHLETALRLADEARELEEEGAASEQARSLAELASVSLWIGDYAEAAARGGEALTKLEALGHEEDTIPVLDLLYHAARFQGFEEEAAEWLQRGLRAASRHRPQETVGARPLRPNSVDPERGSLLGDAAGAHVPRTIVEAAFERADRDRDLLDHYERRGKLLDAAGDPDGAAFARLNLGHLRRAAARYVEAEQSYTAALAAFERLGNRVGMALVRLSRAEVLVDLRDQERAEEEARAALAQAQSCGSRWIEAQTFRALARSAWVRGDADGLTEQLQASERLAQELGNVPQQAALQLFRAQLAIERGDVDGASAALEAFESAPPGARSAPQRISALIYQARLAALLGPDEDDPRRLPRAEGRAGRALEEAQGRHLDELVWRAAWCRAQLRRAQEDLEGELSDLTAAMDGLRRIAGSLPEALRGPYLGDPDCIALRDRFRERA